MSLPYANCLYCHGELQYKVSWGSLLLPGKSHPLCETCQSRLKPLEGSLCHVCSRVLGNGYETDGCCHDCIRWEKDPEWGGILGKSRSSFQYNDFMKEIIARFKFRGDYVLAQAFGQELRTSIKGFEYDLLIPVPLSPERLYERGFNQVEALLAAAGLQWIQVLERVHGEKQSKKSRTERIHHSQVFELTQKSCPQIKNQRIILVDDIYTTGSTLRHAAKMLLEHGAGKVESVTLAR